MADFSEPILALLNRKNYQPLKAKALARKLGVASAQYNDFRRTLRDLLRDGRIEVGKNHGIRLPPPHGTIAGVYRRTSTGVGYVRPNPGEGQPMADVRIRENDALDAATGDTVLVRIKRKPSGGDINPLGVIVRILERANRHFVGTYFEREGQGYVRVDGTVFSHSVEVGDAGAKGARADDKVVIEMIRFPTAEDRGEGVITEVLGPRGQPGVDTLSVIRAYHLPDVFPEDALKEARDAAQAFREDDLDGRQDFTGDLVVTIDPADARDFDDAVCVVLDSQTGHWRLDVHVADVGHFAPAGGPLDKEARNRGTSVYLPQRVVPMFPELISNFLASLQQGRLRYVKSARIDMTPEGHKTNVHFANGAIRVRRRFTYEEVQTILDAYPVEQPVESATPGAYAPGLASAAPVIPSGAVEPEVIAMLLRMRQLALILRERRRRRGALELNLPEVELEYDEQGRVSGGHFRKHDLSHQIIEEFMLTANETVAEHFDSHNIVFLRRVHPEPSELKLESFGYFARSLGYKVGEYVDRFSLQKILERSSNRPDAHAVHFALLRSLKQAIYSPYAEGHYALASDHYCHFTSPIRRYPDLTIHRMLGQWLRTGRVGSSETELLALGDHCSKMERRAEMAERDLIRLKLLTYLSERQGLEMDAIITGVADYGFFAQAANLPVEGLVHISTLTEDYYYFEEMTHSLTGRRTNQRYRLGDRVRVTVVRVDLFRRQLDFRVVSGPSGESSRQRPEDEQPRRKRKREE